jgi:ABC-type multidrug transport system fused ATPase/permease subunit
MKTIKKILFLLSSSERKSAYLILFFTFITALVDMMGVASILPFVAILSNPSLIETSIILNLTFNQLTIFGVKTEEEFLFALGIIVFLLLILSLIVKALTTYLQERFVQLSEYNIGKRLIEIYLRQPYSWFLNRNSADLGKNILSEVMQVINNGIRPLIELIAKSLIAIALIILLFIVDPILTMIVGSSLGSAYLLIFYFVRNYLDKSGSLRLKNNQLRFTAVNEAFSATKEIKLGGLEKIFINIFSNSALIVAKSQAVALVVSQLPKYILEAIAFGGILLIILYIMTQTGNFNSALPIISLYAFAGYRLLPALQQIYVSFTQLIFVGPSLSKLFNDMTNKNILVENQDEGFLFPKNQIVLKNICYDYPESKRTTIKNINIEILAKSIVGFVGPTGSGKTTLVDIILGLLDPKKGSLEIDGKIITKQNVRSWQKSIGYVPQNIYLSDDTIAANIAFGVQRNEIDLDLIEKSSKIANLHNFIINELPKKYDTIIGERGVRLSGGQRQRIGIARALYNKPKVLVLDEATSSLDNQTEESVIKQVLSLNQNMTIIIIAHRLNTVKNCDIIFRLENGQIIDQGSYNKVIVNHSEKK